MLSIQLGVQTHFGIERFGYRTADLGLARRVLERDIAGTRDLGADVQMDPGDGETAVFLIEGNRRFGGDALGRQAGFAQDHRPCHRETASVGGCYQFLWTGAGRALKAGAKRVRGVLQDPAAAIEMALTLLETPFSYG